MKITSAPLNSRHKRALALGLQPLPVAGPNKLLHGRTDVVKMSEEQLLVRFRQAIDGEMAVFRPRPRSSRIK